MPNIALKLNTGRQYPLTLVQPLSSETIGDGAAVKVANLPPDAIVISGTLFVTAALGVAQTLKIGTTTDDDQYGAAIATTVGAKALTVDGKPNGAGGITILPSAALGASGKALLVLTYVLPSRANEPQP